MASVRISRGFPALKIEGGVLPSDYLQTIATLNAPRQTNTDYGLSKSLALKEEISRYWKIANDLHDRYTDYHPRRDLRATQVGGKEWSVPFLRDVFGYNDLAPTRSIELGERIFRLTHYAHGGAVPLLLVTRDFDLDKADLRLGQDGRRQAPHSMMQEYLNAEDAALWGIISNGSKLRILRDNVSLTRPSYIEADLDLIFAEDLYPDFSALWLTIHASRLRPISDKPSHCIIESWRAKAHETGERIRENLRGGVTDSLRQLGNGFLQHPENDGLRKALKNGTLTPDHYFQQLLRLVYRLLFLFTAEERNLLHSPEATKQQREVFAKGYALSQLRERTLRRRHYDKNQDLWLGLQITFHALARGAPGLGLPALGGLFRSDRCPDLDSAAISNTYLLEAIRTIAFFRSGQNLARINYKDMGTEELGSVYESLLELYPVIDVDVLPWTFSFIGEGKGPKTKGSKRKLTGSYYTPPSLVSELIKSTLEPVLSQATSTHPEDPRAAILNLKIIDPACGSGHLLLAAARRLAAEIHRIEYGTVTPNETTRQHTLREVVQHCIYGVDLNPLAVELCKTALWIETVEPGKPLTFLDSHVLHGNSLVGILDPWIMANGIPNDAYKPLTGDDRTACQKLRKRNKQADSQLELFDQDSVLEAAVASLDLDAMPEETLGNIECKSAAWVDLQHDENWVRETLRADLFVGAFFAPKTYETLEIVPHTQDINRLCNNVAQRQDVERSVLKLADTHAFLHWHLAFADIMQDGGFDVVLGNPPWERVKLQEKEFFASRSSEISTAPNKAARNRLIQQLNRDDASYAEKILYARFQTAKRVSEATSQFARSGKRFPLTGVGDLNTYALFAETFLHLVNPRGRAGLIVPTGIATDNTTKAFFDHIVSQKSLVSLFDFENRNEIFTGVHRSYKFCLLTLSGDDTPVPEAEFAFFLHQTEQLKEMERRITLSADDFSLFNPNTRTCPIFRTQRDMEIAHKMYRRGGVLWKEAKGTEPENNPWGVTFQRMFDMSNDSELFKTREDLENDGWELNGNIFSRDGDQYLPLYEAKLFHQYDHRFATFEGRSKKDIKKGNARLLTPTEKPDPKTVALPRYWVPEAEVVKRSPPPPPPNKNRAKTLHSTFSESSRTTRFQADHQCNQRKNSDGRHDSNRRLRSFCSNNCPCLIAYRNIVRTTDERTAILTAIPLMGLGNSGTVITLGSRL